MGMRVRLKADFDMTAYPAECQVILKALQKYGMFVADNGGDWFLSGAPDRAGTTTTCGLQEGQGTRLRSREDGRDRDALTTAV